MNQLKDGNLQQTPNKDNKSIIHEFRKNTRPFRYKCLSLVSSSYALKYIDLLESDIWHQHGYRYSNIRDARVIEATGSVYIPIAKAANSTMKILITDQSQFDRILAEYRKLTNYERQQYGSNSDALIHLIELNGRPGVSRLMRFQLTPAELAKGCRRCFTVVRNPVDRFKSAWSNKVLEKQPGLTESLAQFYSRHEDDYYSIDDLIRYIRETPPQFLDDHVCPMWSLCGEGRIPLEMIGRVESLASDVNAFAEAGLITRESANRIDVYNRSKSEAVELTRKQEFEIRNLYARDFEVFGYD